MPNIGFVRKPEFTPNGIELHHYRTYGTTVQYQAEIPVHNYTVKTSAYIPKSWFPTEEGPYPDKIIMAVNVPPDAKWNKR